jgi:RNA polymerase sigma factor (sigma-70 family)
MSEIFLFRFFSLFPIFLSVKSKTKISTDEELVEACRRGDEAAWEKIILKYQNMLFSIPRRAGLSVDSASDVLQDVFMTLFEKLGTLEQPQFLRTWLTTTTRYKTIHFIRRELHKQPKSFAELTDEDYFEIPDFAPSPDEVLARLEREIQIENAFSQLDERCRRLISLLYLENETVSYSEIAEILEIPLGSIGPTRARCLKKLVKLLPD